MKIIPSGVVEASMNSNLRYFGIALPLLGILSIQFVLDLSNFVNDFGIGREFRTVVLLPCCFIH